MKYGIIMEVNERFLTVLTPEGEFVRAKRQFSMEEIGQEIVYSPLEQSILTTLLKKVRLRKFHQGVVLIVAASLFLFYTAFPLPNNQVYAYMSIDVNPSIEMAINDELEVIRLRAFNNEGEKIIRSLEDWKYEKVGKVTDEIAGSLKSEGYLDNDAEVVVGTVITGTPSKKANGAIEKVVTDMQEDYGDHVLTIQATEKDRKKAVKQGVTLGKYKVEQAKKKVVPEKVNNNEPMKTPSAKPKPKELNKGRNNEQKENQQEPQLEKQKEKQEEKQKMVETPKKVTKQQPLRVGKPSEKKPEKKSNNNQERNQQTKQKEQKKGASEEKKQKPGK